MVERTLPPIRVFGSGGGQFLASEQLKKLKATTELAAAHLAGYESLTLLAAQLSNIESRKAQLRTDAESELRKAVSAMTEFLVQSWHGDS